jgi:hypothetical protein
MKKMRWRVWYHILGASDPDQQMSMDVMAVGPIEAEDAVRAHYTFSDEPYIMQVEHRS